GSLLDGKPGSLLSGNQQPTVFFAIVWDWIAPIAFGGNDSLNVSIGQFLADGICIVALVRQQCLDLMSNQTEQRAKALDIVALARRQDKAERSAFGIAAGVELCAESASRSAKRLGFLSPFFMPTAQ
ncbi:MAG: hypothetical protein AABZ76_21255, partial [Pseudomonadota bacterium]